MELMIYEELYQTPLRICFGVNCSENISLDNPPLKITSQDNYNEPINDYILKNHQNRTVANKITKTSQQGLEMRARNQEAKRIRLGNDMLISGLLRIPMQSKRSRRHRHKWKYTSRWSHCRE